MKRLMYLIFLIITAVSCRQAPPPTLPPEQIIQQSAERMNELAGFHFNIVRDGAPAYVDPPNNTVVFRSAEGDYTPPDRARAVVRVILGFVTDVRVITVGNIQWQTNPLTNEWEELPPNSGFDPTQLFDSAIGLQTILSEDMSDVIYHGLVELDDGPNGRFYHLSGRLSGERLYQMSNQLIGPDAVTADLWIAPETFELVRAILVEPEPAFDEPSTWQVDFSQFDQAIEIEPPQ